MEIRTPLDKAIIKHAMFVGNVACEQHQNT